MKYLFKISLKASVWYRGKPLKPIYIVANSKESASEMLNRHLKSPEVSIKSISKLAEHVSDVMYSAN